MDSRRILCSSNEQGTIPKDDWKWLDSPIVGGVVGPGSARGQGAGQWAAIANPDLFAQGERAVEAIATATGMNLTTASANLQALKSGGLVEARREGTWQYYRIAG